MNHRLGGRKTRSRLRKLVSMSVLAAISGFVLSQSQPQTYFEAVPLKAATLASIIAVYASSPISEKRGLSWLKTPAPTINASPKDSPIYQAAGRLASALRDVFVGTLLAWGGSVLSPSGCK